MRNFVVVLGCNQHEVKVQNVFGHNNLLQNEKTMKLNKVNRTFLVYELLTLLIFVETLHIPDSRLLKSRWLK